MRKLTAAAGILGPALFAAVISGLTLAECPFMRSLGWDPLTKPTFDWPSGLALGPFGWIMTATFLVCGALLSMFAGGLRAELSITKGRIGARLMIWAGIAMMGLAFTTDPTLTHPPVSWHGRLHDFAFLALGLLIIPAMIFLALAFRESAVWKRLSPLSWITVALAIPTFAIKGIVFYAFLAVILAWNEAVAIQLWK